MIDSGIDFSYLSTAYLPPVAYLKVIAGSTVTFIEKFENYQKQSYRNRCYIYSANGSLPLIIPVVRGGDDRKIDLVRIDYSKEWQKQHWRAIFSAYNTSPFFDYYKDDLFQFYSDKEKYQFLFDFNTNLLISILELIGLDVKPEFTTEYRECVEGKDFRDIIHPKRVEETENKYGQYHQVFAHKYGFLKNLSIIDLLFNEGPNVITYL
ncbi:MAG: WbqC family protein [Rikenellaceae bacterium]|nr:WbqC family protein [Rikenellaceae bacterium]